MDAGIGIVNAGAGGGSFARWLADRVGMGGEIVAADLDVRLLEDLNASNVEIRQLDLVRDELPEATFDFVHTRMVLMHIAARDAVLARLVRALRPGGTVMIEEQDVFPIALAPAGSYVRHMGGGRLRSSVRRESPGNAARRRGRLARWRHDSEATVARASSAPTSATSTRAGRSRRSSGSGCRSPR